MASDVDTLLSQFIAEHQAGGEADPRAFLDGAPADERNELTALIDGYLMRAPRREFDAAAYEASAAPEVVEALSRSL
ncbi:MAG: hypothetical protein M3350_04730, partial [Actinomycetota bacterium]|nr:hypothetical protein [Actinomycetota bacterium]